MKQIKYAVISTDDSNSIVIMEDGGIATAYHNGSHMVSEYYQERLTPEMMNDMNDMWYNLAEGKAYYKDWESKDTFDKDILEAMTSWLMVSSERIELVPVSLDWSNPLSIKEFITIKHKSI